MDSEEYRIDRGPHRFRIWDTKGLDQPTIDTEGFSSAPLGESTSSCSAYGAVGLLIPYKATIGSFTKCYAKRKYPLR
ncbi:hypothetical protein ID866_5844 [Astraeus odoratus]|nr:hypothetical protein ID866_5844 [Astraeus odoratus]